jgi:hypothetical protein
LSRKNLNFFYCLGNKGRVVDSQVVSVHRVPCLGRMIHATNYVGYHEHKGVIPCVHAYDKVSNLWQRAEFVECFHVPTCVCGWMPTPCGGGQGLGLLGKNLHQVVLWGRTICQGCRMDAMGIVGYCRTLGHYLEE